MRFPFCKSTKTTGPFYTQQLNLKNRKMYLEIIEIGENRIEPFRFKERLGTGGYGAVYKAIAPNGRIVAIKVTNLRGDIKNQHYNAFLNEFKMLLHLSGEPHVVHVFRAALDPDWEKRPYAYLIMEIGDESLDKLICKMNEEHMRKNCGSSNEYISHQDKKLIWHELIKIVDTLQRHNISHMDMKPLNILRFGNILKICDLGISKFGRRGDRGGGTPNFSPPEALIKDGRFSPKTDIWSMGAILYYMTYGKQPNWNPENRSFEPPYGMCATQDPYLQDVLVRTLMHDPELRPTIHELKRHPYTLLP